MTPSSSHEIICVVGTRPEAIKMSPVILALQQEASFKVTTVCSGQHADIVKDILDWFGVKIDINLNVMTHNQSLPMLTSRLMAQFSDFLGSRKPRAVIAQGDTTTVFCAALCCFYMGIDFGHVEAGLRTGNVYAPFPEEFNRVACGKLARWNFCPTPLSAQNMAREGAPETSIFLTGNTVVDALQMAVQKLGPLPPREPGRVRVLMTAHRRENFGAPIENIFKAVLRVIEEYPQVEVFYPVHPNPNVKGPANRFFENHPNIHLLPPLTYPEMVQQMRECDFILTDSGGVQEEAPSLGKPVLVLRNESDRPESLESGAAILVGTQEDKIVSACRKLLTDQRIFQEMSQVRFCYGDGTAARSIARILKDSLSTRSS